MRNQTIDIPYELVRLAEDIKTQQVINWPRAKIMRDIFAKRILNILDQCQKKQN